MKTWKKTLALLLAAAVLTLAGCSALRRPGNVVYSFRDFTGPVVSIEVSEVSCDVELTPSDDGACHVKVWDFENVDRRIDLKDGKLVIESDTVVRRGVLSFGFFEDARQKIEIALPAGEYESLKISTVSGDVKVPADFSFSGRIGIETTSGDGDLEPVKCGDLSWSSISGDVSLDGTSCGSADFSTTSGDVRLDGADAGKDLKISSVSGDVSLKKVRSEKTDIGTVSGEVSAEALDTGSLKVGTVSGDVSLSLASDIRVRTDSGSGTVRIPEDMKDPGSSDTVETVSGDIRIGKEK